MKHQHLVATGLSLMWAIVAPGVATAAESPKATEKPATYHVTLVKVYPPRLSVAADLPIDGKALTMDTTRPAGIPVLDASGWPGLVSNLRVTNTADRRLGTMATGAAGWQLAEAYEGRLRVTYELDYSALAARGWPAPRETGLEDAEHLVLPCRSIFVTTPAVRESVVSFLLPKGWRPVTPWAPHSTSKTEFVVHDAADLASNLLALTREDPDVVVAGNFRLQVVAMGPWQAARAEVRRVLGAVIPRLVELMGTTNHENYLVVLLPVAEDGGESYRRSFALTFAEPPTRANSAAWGNKIAHEVFHLWNGWRLQGADYPSSQWFQEGFTEYAANLSMIGAKLIDEQRFLSLLADHVGNYRKLTTSLEGSGTHKGPPLYSAGALVAFTWDVTILEVTKGERGFGNFLRALWKQTDRGQKPYAWPDIKAALDRAAPYDWEAFYNSHIRGAEPLPLEQTFARVGLHLEMTADGSPRLTIDKTAPASARNRWQSILSGR